MSDLPADSPALASQPPSEGWSRNKLIFFIACALVLHIALIFIFGTKKQIVPRDAANVPHLQLVDNTDEFIALGDPTLFARPNAHDFVTAFWQCPPASHIPTQPVPSGLQSLPGTQTGEVAAGSQVAPTAVVPAVAHSYGV